MLELARRWEDRAELTLFDRIGAFLDAQGLAPEPANYSFAYAAVTDPAVGVAVARLVDGGVRLGSREIEALGGSTGFCRPVQRPQERPTREAASAPDDDAARLMAETQAQVDGFADLMRSIRHETTDFGRDLRESAAAIERQPPIAGLDEIARATGAMVARLRDAEVRLATATAETDALRDKLGEAQAIARRDPLTGLANRLAFTEGFARGPVGGSPRCLAVADVDHFKRFNDEHGHGVGDRVLSAIGRGLEAACPGQLVARYGGEEFALLIEGATLQGAAAMLDEARDALGARQFRDRDTGAPLRRITLSAGVVTVRPGDTLDVALARADQLLYLAKAEGRDRVCAG